MPTLIKILTPDGVEVADYRAESLADAAQYEPDEGIYTVANTFNKYDTLKLDAHFDRMEDSAQREDMNLALDRKRVRATLRQMIDEADYGDVRFRITVPKATPQRMILSIEPFTPPGKQLIEQGVRCITAADSARPQAESKTTDWMHQRKQLQDAMPDHIYDTFLLDKDGNILEGLGANFYAIFNHELRTAGENVLKGISQQIVFDVAEGIIPVVKYAAHISEMPYFDEAFLTSSSRGIIPVVEIDEVTIGSGKPGPITLQLRAAYEQWMAAHLVAL